MSGDSANAREDSERGRWSMTVSFTEPVSAEVWRILTGAEPTPIYDRVLAEHRERWINSESGVAR